MIKRHLEQSSKSKKGRMISKLTSVRERNAKTLALAGHAKCIRSVRCAHVFIIYTQATEKNTKVKMPRKFEFLGDESKEAMTDFILPSFERL